MKLPESYLKNMFYKKELKNRKNKKNSKRIEKHFKKEKILFKLF